MVLELNHVTKFYTYGKQRQLVINDFSAKFPPMGLVGIIGKSGTGKSTLLNLIAGIEKPNQGKILIDGNELNYRQIYNYQNNYISYVYQFYNLVESLTVYENIVLLAKIKGKKIAEKKITQLSEKLSITPLLDKFPKELSGGQKQRVALVRAFLCDTPILIADEPTGALNSEMANEVMELLKWYAKKHLVIVISHNYKLLTKYTRLIIDLNKNNQVYNFYNQVSYHKYFYNLVTRSNKINFYIKRQLLYQKNKIIMMFASQIFTICAFVLLVSGANGLWQYINNNYKSDPIKDIVEISKKDYSEMNFTELQISKIKDDSLIDKLTYKLDFILGSFIYKDKDLSLTSYQLYKTSNLDYIKGKYPSKNNQVIINQETSQKYKLDINDSINFKINEQIYTLTVSAIINDNVNYGKNIYIDSTYIDDELKANVTNYNVLIAKTLDFKKLESKYEKNYFVINLHNDYVTSYESLFKMAAVVIAVFLLISFAISLILISIILKTILIERKKDICLMLSNGLTLNKARQLFAKEMALIGLTLGIMATLLAQIVISIVKMFNLEGQLFNIPNLFILPKLVVFKYDIYFLLILIYVSACFLVGTVTSLQISKMDMSVLLKED